MSGHFAIMLVATKLDIFDKRRWMGGCTARRDPTRDHVQHCVSTFVNVKSLDIFYRISSRVCDGKPYIFDKRLRHFWALFDKTAAKYQTTVRDGISTWKSCWIFSLKLHDILQPCECHQSYILLMRLGDIFGDLLGGGGDVGGVTTIWDCCNFWEGVSTFVCQKPGRLGRCDFESGEPNQWQPNQSDIEALLGGGRDRGVTATWVWDRCSRRCFNICKC